MILEAHDGLRELALVEASSGDVVVRQVVGEILRAL